MLSTKEFVTFFYVFSYALNFNRLDEAEWTLRQQ